MYVAIFSDNKSGPKVQQAPEKIRYVFSTSNFSEVSIVVSC